MELGWKRPIARYSSCGAAEIMAASHPSEVEVITSNPGGDVLAHEFVRWSKSPKRDRIGVERQARPHNDYDAPLMRGLEMSEEGGGIATSLPSFREE